MEHKILYKISVKGMVQGVGFRWNAATEARKRGISGFVRNLPDGSVYIEAEGTKKMLDSYVEWCKKGPLFSSVESVITGSFPPEGYSGFAIEH